MSSLFYLRGAMLNLTDVTFLYHPNRGVSKVNLTVAQGECVGITGDNGAGKSTLLALVASSLIPQGGTISLVVEAVPGGRKKTFPASMEIGYRRRVGYMSEGEGLYPEMTVKAYLRYRAQIKGERYLRLRRRIREALLRCDLMGEEHTLIGSLSYGMQRRVVFAEAILLLPTVLVLDDPFVGLDQTMSAAMVKILADVGKSSHILISGHDTDRLKTCCHRVLTMKEGRLIEEDAQ